MVYVPHRERRGQRVSKWGRESEIEREEESKWVKDILRVEANEREIERMREIQIGREREREQMRERERGHETVGHLREKHYED